MTYNVFGRTLDPTLLLIDIGVKAWWQDQELALAVGFWFLVLLLCS